MKKYLTLLLLGLMMLSCKEGDKPDMSVDQVSELWLSTPIKKVKSPDAMGMMEAFQKQWPTRMGSEWFGELKLPEEERDFICSYDEKNGYLSYVDPRKDPDAESMAAKVWPRSNGHQLFVVNLFQPTSVKQNLLAFYDYDPATKTLTPETHPAMQFVSDYPDAEIWYEINPKDDELEVYEYFGHWEKSLRHVYQWNGMTFDGPVTEFEGINNILEEFNQNYMTYEMGDFTKYALFDIDEDGEPELWLSTDNEEYQAVLSIVEGEIKMIAGKDFKRHLLFHKDIVGDAGGCGTGCFYVHYTKLLHSAPEFEFEDMQSYNFQTDDMDHEYSKNGEPLTEAEADALFESFGEVLDDPEVEWRPLR